MTGGRLLRQIFRTRVLLLSLSQVINSAVSMSTSGGTASCVDSRIYKSFARAENDSLKKIQRLLDNNNTRRVLILQSYAELALQHSTPSKSK